MTTAKYDEPLFLRAVFTLYGSDSALLDAIKKVASVSPEDQEMLAAELAKARSELTGSQPFATSLDIGEDGPSYVVALIHGGTAALGLVATQEGPATYGEALRRAHEMALDLLPGQSSAIVPASIVRRCLQ